MKIWFLLLLSITPLFGRTERLLKPEKIQQNSLNASIREITYTGTSDETILLIIPDKQVIPDERNELFTMLDNYFTENSSQLWYSVRLLSLKGDRGRNPTEGSEFYINNFLPGNTVFCLYLDLEPDRVPRVHTESTSSTSRYRVIETLINSLQSNNTPFVYSSYEQTLYRTGLKKANSIQNLWSGVTSVIYLTSEEKKLPDSEAFIKSISSMAAKKILYDIPGRNFYTFSLQKRYFFVEEKAVIMIILGISGLAMLIALIFSKWIRIHFRMNAKYIWTLPGKVLFIFIFSHTATLAIMLLPEITELSSLIEYFPRQFFILKVAIVLFIYSMAFGVIKDTPFSKSPYFNSFSALILAFINLIFTSTLSLSFSFYLLWSILMILLFILVKNYRVKRFCLLLSPLLLFILVLGNLEQENINFTMLLITSKIQGNIILTLTLAPYLFLYNSYNRHRARKRFRITYIHSIMQTAFFGMVAIGLVFLLTDPPGISVIPGKLSISSSIDIKNQQLLMDVRGNHPLRHLTITTPYREHKVTSDSFNTLLTSPLEGFTPFHVTVEKDLYLKKSRYRVKISSQFKADYTDLILKHNPDNRILYSTRPFTSDRGTTRIHVEESPELPLTFEIITDIPDDPVLEITAGYPESPVPLEVTCKETMIIEQSVRLKQEVVLK